MSYENFLIREMNGEADYQQGDTNCSDCNQRICACESLAEWYAERDAVCSDSDGDVRVFPAPSEFPLQLMYRTFPVPVLAKPKAKTRAITSPVTCGEARESTDTKLKRSVEQVASEPRGGENSFSEWLESHGDGLKPPQSFTDWLDRYGDIP